MANNAFEVSDGTLLLFVSEEKRALLSAALWEWWNYWDDEATNATPDSPYAARCKGTCSQLANLLAELNGGA